MNSGGNASVISIQPNSKAGKSMLHIKPQFIYANPQGTSPIGYKVVGLINLSDLL